jgi:hypothetical protein
MAKAIFTLNDRKQNGIGFYMFDLSSNNKIDMQVNNSSHDEL